MELKDQTMTTTTTIGSNGATNLRQDFTQAEFSWTVGAPRTAYSTGKTISLGDYQFARIGVRIEVEHSAKDSLNALETARYLAREITEQEAASVLRAERQPQPFTDGGFSKYEVTIEYGLTLKVGRFDSAKVDIALTRNSSGDLQSVISEMRDILKEHVMAEARIIRESMS